MSTADAEAREVAWLTTSGDSLPALLASAGGPWQVVQAFWPGAKFPANKTGIYVQRRRTRVERFGGRRIMPKYEFFLKLVWPVKSTAAGIAETEAQNFSNAIELLRQRVSDLPGDKSHGSRFLAVAEAPAGTFFDVDYADPEVTIPQQKALRATVTYPADDPEILG